MKRRSFRLRLAVISMLLSGLVLLVFGAVAWWSLSRSQESILDADLRAFGYRFVARSGPNVSGQRQEETLVGLVGVDRAPYRFFAILRRNGDELFRSSEWPAALEPQAFPASDEVLDPQPEIVQPGPKPGAPEPPERELRPILKPRYETVTSGAMRYRMGIFANPDLVLVSGADLQQFGREASQLRNAFLVALPAALGVIAIGAWWLGRQALSPIRMLQTDMERLSAQALDQRLEAGRADVEFAEIIAAYNAMLERLERSFHQATRFSADASHELKTPLAIMRGTLEQAMNRCAEDPEAQQVISQLLEQTGKQAAILEGLLLLSRADAGQLKLSREPIDLSACLTTWVEDAGLLAEGRSIAVESEIEPGLRMKGDPVLLQRVAHNLFTNAVRYNEKGGRLRCRLRRRADRLVWTVANTGVPIREEDRDRIFERFQRGASAASEEGVGLGLSLAREILTAHGGRIQVGEAEAGWTVFEVRLPAVEEPEVTAL